MRAGHAPHPPLQDRLHRQPRGGEDTLCYGLAARLKRRDVAIEVVHEVARRCPLPINEETSVAAQSWILHTQIAEELVAQARYPVVVCDRSVLDNYVYLLLAAGRQEGPERLVEYWLQGYDLLVHVPIVESPEPGRRPLARSRVPAAPSRSALVQEIAERRAPRPAARLRGAAGLAGHGRADRLGAAAPRPASRLPSL